MRIAQTNKITLSEDLASTPKEVRFSVDEELIDTSSLIDGVAHTKTYPTGTYTIDLDEIGASSFLYLKGDQQFTYSFDAGTTDLIATASKPTSMWSSFTTLQIDTTQATRITIVVAGS